MRTLLLTCPETEVLLEPDTLLAGLRAAFRGYSLDRGARATRTFHPIRTWYRHRTLPGHRGRHSRLHRQGARQVSGAVTRDPRCALSMRQANRRATRRYGLDPSYRSADGALQRPGHGHARSARRPIGGRDRRRHARRPSIALAPQAEADRCRSRLRHGAGSRAGVRGAHASVARSHNRSERFGRSGSGSRGHCACRQLGAHAVHPSGMLQPGTHVSTIGPDEPGKCEVSAEVIRDAVFVCDDRDLAVSTGAIGGAKLGADAISAELGEVIGGAHPGRMNAEQITVYGGVGLAFQDAVGAWQIYRAALSRGVGREIDFLA
jgi:hypothetical protein